MGRCEVNFPTFSLPIECTHIFTKRVRWSFQRICLRYPRWSDRADSPYIYFVDLVNVFVGSNEKSCKSALQNGVRELSVRMSASVNLLLI